MIRTIVKYPEPVLTTPGAPVTEFDTPALRQLIADMFETMYAANGVGLAAPQIGLSQRLTVIDCGEDEERGTAPQKIVLINPQITRREGKQTGEEGCLSIPGFRADVTRAQSVTVRAQDVTGAWRELEATDHFARAVQHEVDHLDGILYLSYLSTLKRDLIKRKIRKLQKDGE